MAVATEKIPDKARFDVYAMLIILTCFFTGGAAWFLYDHLTTHWGFGQEVKPEKAEHITQINGDPEKHPDIVVLRKEDIEDYAKAQKALGQDVELAKGYEWPAGFDPLNFPIRENLKSMEEPAGSGKFWLLYNDPSITDSAKNAEKQAEFIKQQQALMAAYKTPGRETVKEAPKEGGAEAPKDAATPANP
jgi:hypothetical protein